MGNREKDAQDHIPCIDNRTYPPELYEILQRGSDDEKTVEKGISQKQREELVIVEAHAIIHPGTVVIHFQDACAADATVMRSVRL